MPRARKSGKRVSQTEPSFSTCLNAANRITAVKEMAKADSVKRKKTTSRRHKTAEPTQPDEPETESAASEAATETSDPKPPKAKPTYYSSYY